MKKMRTTPATVGGGPTTVIVLGGCEADVVVPVDVVAAEGVAV